MNRILSYCRKSAIIIVILGLVLSGCQFQRETTAADPLVSEYEGVIYCTYLGDGEDVLKVFESNLDVTVTDYAEQKDTIDILIDFQGNYSYIFNGESTQFTITQEDQNLPYYCAHGYLEYDIEKIGVMPFVLAIDFEKGYFIIKPNGNIDDCIVASFTPNVDPHQIHDHFQSFLDLYYYPNE